MTFSLLSVYTKNVMTTVYNGCDFYIFSIEYLRNYGAAFSMFNMHTYFLITITSIILVATIFYIIKNINLLKNVELVFSSLLTSGIICNLVERISDGYVTDYIRLNFMNFPIFNLSDVFICTGAFILICNILFNNDSRDINN